MLLSLLLALSLQISGIVSDACTGKGIEGVVVSDGYTCTVTDAGGKYFITADSLARTINLTIPREYEIPIGEDGRPAFFKYIGSADMDFRLTPRRHVSDNFSLIAVADAHIRDDMNLERFTKESIPDIQKSVERRTKKGPVIGIALGDQLWDVMSRAAEVRDRFTSIKYFDKTMPFFYCIGNHDYDSSAGDTKYEVTENFVRNFGPTDYSFDIGRVHFVVMDDIQYTGLQRDGIKISYTTGLNDRQKQWLRQDLSLVKDKENKLIVFCVHSPLYGRFAYKDEVKTLLKEFAEAHVLSGHEHNLNNVFYDGIWEHNIQSIGGSWWLSNLAPNGAPLGYGVLCFEGAALAEQYNKATNEDFRFQMRVYSGNDSYGPDTPNSGVAGEPKRTNVYSWPEELKGHFVVRIWDGTPDWEVKFVQNGVETPMTQTKEPFFDAASAAFMVDIFGAPYGGSRVYKAKVDAFWSVKAPSGDPAKEKDWEIVATHKMPNGRKVVYSSKVLMRDFRGFAAGSRYEDGGMLSKAASKCDLKESLVMNQKWVPYPSYSDRAGWDAMLGEYKPQLIALGEKHLDFDWLVLRATDYLEYNRSGNRHAQEDRMAKNTEALSSLMVAELAEGKGRFIDDIMNGVFHFCESTSWAVSDHLYKFQKVKSPIPDYRENILTLFQGDHAQMLSWAYYFFHKEFDLHDPAISSRLEYEIRRRELEPYMQRDDFDWMGFRPNITPNNWNPWCNSNAILCFMLIENDRDALCAFIDKSMRSVDKYISSLMPDGACDEGTLYWYKSAGNLLNYLQCLEMITGGKLTVWNEPLIRKFGEYIVNANISGKWQANFADAKPTTSPGIAAIYRYGKAVGSKVMMDYAVNYNARNKYNPIGADWSIFYVSMENLKAALEIKDIKDSGFKPYDFVSYPNTELLYIRSGKGYLAAKGGHNKERHNHNDVGSCIYFYDSQPVLVDAGSGTYNKSTFDNTLRYKIWNMSSDYHNLPQVNGCAQAYGSEYKAVGTKADKKTRTFTADIAGAYPDSANVKSWKRTYKLAKNGELEINDSFEISGASKPNELNFLVAGEPLILSQGKIKLNAGLSLNYDSGTFKARIEAIPLAGTGISKAFGDTLYRITLKANRIEDKGSYRLKINL